MRAIGTQTRIPPWGRSLAAMAAVTFLAAPSPGCRKRETAPRASASGTVPVAAGSAAEADLGAIEVSPWLPPYVAPEGKGVDLSKTPTLYVVNYAHLDTQWRWSFPQTIDELLPYTVHRNVEYFDRFPSHVFSWTGASRYQMIQEYYPEDFQLIRTWVKRGRWFPAGNQWEECDVLVPSSESILRQILVGAQFFQREFGTASQEFMLPDSFGFPASLPSLLAHAGLRGFSTQKLTWQSAMGIPFNVGRWNGVDGRGVIAALNPGSYGAAHRENLSTSKTWLKRLEQNASTGRLKVDYLYNGTGDIGGAPHEVSMKTIETSLKNAGPVKVKVGPADLMFREISDVQAAQLPVYEGDLLLTEHSAGSLTSQAFVKQQNRTNELLADAAERAAVAAELLGAASYPTEALEQGWRLTLRSQFHDILPGTSLPKAYEYSWNDEFVAMNRFAYALMDSVAGVARGLDTRIEGVPLVVFNPLSVSRTDVVEAQIPEELRQAKQLTAFMADGSPLPTQIIAGTDGERRVLFSATLPAVSFAVYGLRAATPPAGDATLKSSERQIANSRYRVSVNEGGDVSSIVDLAADRELLAAPMQHAFLTEWPSEFPAWNMDWVDRMQTPRSVVTGAAKIDLLEEGPVRTTLRIERESEGSLFVQTVRLAAGPAGERVEFVDRIDWKSSQCSLKATFPLSLSHEKATYNWDLGTVLRGNNHPKQYEVPTHSWLDLTDAKQEYGVTLLTPAKYGSDKPNDSTLRLTLLYTPAAPDYFREQSTQDWGRHLVTYAVVGHRGDWRVGNAPWQARRLEQPLLAFAVSKHDGKLGRQFQLVEPSNPQVALQAIKRAEDGTSVIVRLQELWGRPARQHLQFPVTIQAAAEMTGLEQQIAPIGFAGQSIRLDFLPNQLRTISVKLTPSRSVSTPASSAVPLDYNLDAISSNSDRSDGDCDGKGTTYPAEMLTQPISVAGVDYRLGPFAQRSKNALRAEGQAITLPTGYRRAHLLAAATAGPIHVDLQLGEETLRFGVAPFTGYLGQWDNRIFAGAVPSVTFSVQNPLLRLAPAYLYKDRLAWTASHVHRPGGDVPYQYGYLYSYSFDIPPGATVMSLPRNPELLIFAVAVSTEDNTEIRALSSLWPELARDARFAQRFDSIGR